MGRVLGWAVLAAVVGGARAQSGFCTGNAAEADVVCGAGYALRSGAGGVERGAGNAPDSAGALAACCDRVFCTVDVCAPGRILQPDAGTTLPAEGLTATDSRCCQEDYAPESCMADDICVDCISPYAKHGPAESGNGGFELTATNNPDGTIACDTSPLCSVAPTPGRQPHCRRWLRAGSRSRTVAGTLLNPVTRFRASSSSARLGALSTCLPTRSI